MPAEPPPAPPRVNAERFASARSWVGQLGSEGTDVVWANYDMASGRSSRTVIDRVNVKGGERQELASEAHPPRHLQAFDGYVYWIYKLAPLKRVPLSGGQPEILRERGGADCFAMDSSGLYLIDNGDVIRMDPDTKVEERIAVDSFGDCPVLLGDQIYWTERKGIYRVPKAGGVAEKLVDTSKPKGLVAYDGALYSCFGGETLTRVDPTTGKSTPIRDFCRGDGLVVSKDAHWFKSAYFEGWPAVEKWRIAEVTPDGVSWLFDGEGVSKPRIVEDDLVWFGRPHGGTPVWEAYKAPLP